MLRAICRRPLHRAVNEADHRHRRRAGGTARCKDSNFMDVSRLRYLRDWSQAERGWFNVRGIEALCVFGRDTMYVNRCLPAFCGAFCRCYCVTSIVAAPASYHRRDRPVLKSRNVLIVSASAGPFRAPLAGFEIGSGLFRKCAILLRRAWARKERLRIGSRACPFDPRKYPARMGPCPRRATLVGGHVILRGR